VVTAASRATRGVLVLADISGYTAFLQAVNTAHGAQMAAMTEVPPAYPLMTSLLDAIVDQLTPPFVLSKFEGDAVFSYAACDGFALRGRSVLDCIKTCYDAFRELLDKTKALMPCSCEACAQVSTLELKFVLHQGDYVVQSIVGREELFGPDVTMAHLLLKNTLDQTIGRSAYVLITEPAIEQLEVPVDGAIAHSEQYEHYPSIRSFVFTL
jgi:Protein of unknown function (DUF2652)